MIYKVTPEEWQRDGLRVRKHLEEAAGEKWHLKKAVAEMKAKVVEAEAQVPLAIAEAFRSGRLGVMDFYKMENV